MEIGNGKHINTNANYLSKLYRDKHVKQVTNLFNKGWI